MNQGKFWVQLASVPDADAVVGELWYAEHQVAELRNMGGVSTLLIFNSKGGAWWEFDCLEFADAITQLRHRLQQ